MAVERTSIGICQKFSRI